MDSDVQRAALTMRSRTYTMLTPQERAEDARRRIAEAMENLKLRRRLPACAVAFALAGGFLVGYSPEAKRLFMNNIGGLLRFLATIKL